MNDSVTAGGRSGPNLSSFFLQRHDRRLSVSVSGDGPALLFAHGLFGTHMDSASIAQPASGFTVIAPDLWGRGQSRPATSVEAHSFDDHADDLLGILDHLDIGTAVVAGSSFGAAVVVAFALRHLERVRGLVLIASAFGALVDEMGEGDLQSYADLADRIASDGLEGVAAQESERTGSDRPARRWLQHDETSLIAWLRAVPQYRPFERGAELSRLTVPTLVVPGADSVHTPELSTAYARALPNATVAEAGSMGEALREFLEPFKAEAP
jgi:3-oxoadipate enol-lactonase